MINQSRCQLTLQTKNYFIDQSISTNLFQGTTDMMKDESFFRKVDPNCFSPEQRIKEMDETGTLTSQLNLKYFIFIPLRLPGIFCFIVQQSYDKLQERSSACQLSPVQDYFLETIFGVR